MILDTNAISAMAEGDTALEKVLPDVASQFIPVICVGEYRAGIIQSKARKELERWLAMLEQSRSVLGVEVNTAHFYAGVIADLRKRGRMIPINDVCEVEYLRGKATGRFMESCSRGTNRQCRYKFAFSVGLLTGSNSSASR